MAAPSYGMAPCRASQGCYHAANVGDSDGDGIPDDLDPYPNNQYNNSAWWYGGYYVIDGSSLFLPDQWHVNGDSDTDYDGIPDSVEVANGMDRLNPADADHLRYFGGQTDGISWKQAYDRHWLDALQDNSTDTDGDGMSDLYETVNGLDMYNPADAVDARIGYRNLGESVAMNDFILNIEPKNVNGVSAKDTKRHERKEFRSCHGSPAG